MQPATEQQLAQAFKACREARIPNINEAALKMGMHPDSLRRRENGSYAIKLTEFMALANAADAHPVTLLWEMLSQCDRVIWHNAAAKLNCTPMQARQRLEKAAAQRKLTPWQVWLKLEKDQIAV